MKNTHSEIKVYPKNWDRKLNASLNKVWYCYYYFYSKDCPNGTLVKFRGMNRAKSLEEKQAVTQWLIDREIDLLKRGYNPIKKTIEVINGFVNENTPFIQALEIAKSKIKVADSTMVSIKHTLKIVYKAAEKTGVSFTPISKVKKKGYTEYP